MQCISGGINARLEIPLLIFQNKSRNYPIRGVPDDIRGVAYRKGIKGWIDRINMLYWVREPRVIKELPNQRLRKIFIYNCSGHNINEENINAPDQFVRCLYTSVLGKWIGALSILHCDGCEKLC